MMNAQDKKKIKKAVDEAREITKEIYKDDKRLNENVTADAGVVREMDIVFKTLLEKLLK